MRARRALLLLGLFACGGAQRTAAPPAALRVRVTPERATVYIDEQFVGSARVLAKAPARLPPGKHQVTIEAPGYFPHDLEVVLAPGVTTVEVSLRLVPP